MKKLILISTISLFALASVAQETPEVKKVRRIRVESRSDGKTIINERTYDTDEAMQNALDSLSPNDIDNVSVNKNDGNSTVIIKKKDGKVLEMRSNRLDSVEEGLDRLNDVRIRFDKRFDDFDQAHPRFREPLTWVSKQSTTTVRGLNVFPNRPFNNVLNVRFNAPKKGNVTIRISDVEGKEIAREVVKDFSGEYVGQVTLKNPFEKGTLFITVTQGEDGAVKRVAID